MQALESRNDGLSLVDVVALLWSRRVFAAFCVVGGGLIGITWALLQSPLYRTQVVFMPVNMDAGIGGIARNLVGQMGGIASLVGLQVDAPDERQEAVEFLRSRLLTEKFIDRNGLLPILFQDRWDASRKAWKSNVAPTPGLAFQVFSPGVRAIREDRRTGLVTLTITWKDPVQAAIWANGLVAMANAELRQAAIRDAQGSIKYLNDELTKTEVVEMRQVIFRLIESQVRNIMLANVREQYAFKVIDPAVIPDPSERIRPRPVAMTVGGIVLGGVFALLWVLGAYSLGRPKSEAGQRELT